MEIIKHKKSLGQNFISDKNLLQAIVKDSCVDNNTNVLEIGVGMASLSREIASKCKNLICYEIDKSLQEIIEQNLQEFENVKVIYKDILKVSNEEITSNFKSSFIIIANLPYYITTPIIFKFLEGNFDLKSLTIMVQKEVAERIVSVSGTKQYGTLSVQVNAICDAKICRIVKRQMFNPAPNVDSAVIKLDINKNKYDIKNKSIFDRLVKCAFMNRRKILKSNIKKEFNLSEVSIENIFSKLNLNLDIRGERLTVSQFVDLSNLIN